MILGEALGEKEAYAGKPFQGRAGAQLNRTFSRSKMKRDEFVIDNCVRCRPPGNELVGAEYEQAALAHCGYWRKTVLTHKPKVIVPVGNVPLRQLTGLTGIIQKHEPKRGYVYDVEVDGYKCFAVPTVHPSFVMQGHQNFTGVHIFDFSRALEVAKHGPPVYDPYYILTPTKQDIKLFIQEAKEYLGDDHWLCADIETPYASGKSEEEFGDLVEADIIRISFAFRKGRSITIPWSMYYWELIQEVLLLPSPYIVWWNQDFDVPRVLSTGMQIGPKNYDAMWAFHYLQSDLPKGLAFVAPFYTPLREWKSQSFARPEWYSCVDADATVMCHEGIKGDLVKQGRFQRFLSHGVELDIHLKHIGRGKHSGLLVDQKARKELRGELETRLADLNTKLQTLIPEEVKPKDQLVQLKQPITCPRCLGKGYEPSKEKLKAEYKLPLKDIGKLLQIYTPPLAFPDVYTSETCKKCEGSGMVNTNLKAVNSELPELQGYVNTGKVWQKTLPFLFGSTDQVLEYIKYQKAQGLKGYKVYRNHDTDNETADEDALKKLIKDTSDPVFQLILDCKGVQKVMSNHTGYVNEKGEEVIPTYQPDSDGRVRTDFSQKPSTLRLASSNPNFQNVDKRGEYAKKIRNCFVAAPGYKLAEPDWSAIEAVLVGYYAKDPEYIKAAKLGVHGILASYVLLEKGIWKEHIDLKWDNTDIKAAVKEIKKSFKKEYDDCKHVVHGSNYLGTAKKMYLEFPESFPKIGYAEQMQELYFSTIAGKVRKWQHETLQEAHTNRYLTNAFQYRHYFWDVLSWNPAKKGMDYGQDAKRAIAFKPQSTAAAISKEVINRIAQDEDATLYEALRLQIHDALLFELRDDEKFEYYLNKAITYMTYEVPELGGLSIGVEAASGYRWGDLM